MNVFPVFPLKLRCTVIKRTIDAEETETETEGGRGGLAKRMIEEWRVARARDTKTDRTDRRRRWSFEDSTGTGLSLSRFLSFRQVTLFLTRASAENNVAPRKLATKEATRVDTGLFSASNGKAKSYEDGWE